MIRAALERSRKGIERRHGLTSPFNSSTWTGADAGGFECELLELVPDQRLVFRWGFVGPERTHGPTYDSLLTVTLREAPDGATLLTLVHERLDELAAAMPRVAESVGPGWQMVLDKLAALAAAVA